MRHHRPAERPLLLGTRSAGKLRELEPMFRAAGIPIIGLADAGVMPSPDEEAVEAFDTFEENALAKARHYARVSGRPAVADDSGLAVEVLGGEPGVRSKRWSGRTDLEGAALDAANNAALLSALRGIDDRRAKYVCVVALAEPDGTGGRVWRGETTGRMLDVPRGTGGFGYDPYFLSDELGKTFGEAALGEKERVSHRGRAFRAMLEELGNRESGFGNRESGSPNALRTSADDPSTPNPDSRIPIPDSD